MGIHIEFFDNGCTVISEEHKIKKVFVSLEEGLLAVASAMGIPCWTAPQFPTIHIKETGKYKEKLENPPNLPF